MISNSRDRVWLRVNRILKLASVQHELRLSGFELDGGLQSEMMSSEVVPESSQLACEDLPFRFFFIFFFIYIFLMLRVQI